MCIKLKQINGIVYYLTTIVAIIKIGILSFF